MLIRSAAHFYVCECGRHGRIVTATGESSILFCSKETARDALSVVAKEKNIAADEHCVVLSQIDGSALAEKERDVPINAWIKTEALNAIHETIHESWREQAEAASRSGYVN